MRKRIDRSTIGRIPWTFMAGGFALLLAVGLSLLLAQFQVQAQPAGEASGANLEAETAVITSQIRSPNRDAYITEKGSLTIGGIAWRAGSEVPYLTDDVFLSVERTTDNAYLLSWTSVVSASYYLVEEATEPQFGDAETIYFGPDTEYPHTQDDDGTYYYRVKADETGIESSRWSNVVSVDVPWEDEATNAEGSTASAALAADSAITVQVRIDDGDWHTTSVTETAWGAEWSYEWTMPEERGVQHVIQARATEGGDGFGPEDAITVTLDNENYFVHLPFLFRRWPPVPYPPSLDTIDNPDKNVSYLVNWSYDDDSPEVPDPSTYTLQEARDADFTVALEEYEVAGTSKTITDPSHEKVGGTYYYRVRGHNTYGPGEWSNIRATVVRVLPYAPTLSAIDNPDHEPDYTIEWSYDHTYPSVNTYKLEEATEADFSDAVTIYEGSDTSYEITGQEDGTYYYRVRGRNAYGGGTWSASRSTTVETWSYFDDFSDYQSGWPREWTRTRGALYRVRPNEHPGCPDCKYEGGDGYVIARRVGTDRPLARFGPEVKVPSADYKIEFRVRWFETAYNATYQVFFGSDKDFEEFYALLVRQNDGRCEYALVEDSDDSFIKGWHYTDHIDCDEGDDGGWDEWKIRRKGDEITLWVNDHKLGDWEDSSYGANRYFGVGCTTYEGFTPSKPEFDDWSVELLD